MPDFSLTTIKMLEMLPTWMRAKVDRDHSSTAAFVNILGEQLEQLDNLIIDAQSNVVLDVVPYYEQSLFGPSQMYPSTYTGIAIGEIDLIYKVNVRDQGFLDTQTEYAPDDDPNTVTTDIEPLDRAYTLYDFYCRDKKKYYYSDDYVYVREEYDSLTINDITYTTLTPHMVWGPYDEIGLMFGCPRLKDERNAMYKTRLLGVYRNFGSATENGLRNYISRSLGISKEDVSVADLTPSIVTDLINADGSPSAKLKGYINISNIIDSRKTDVYWEVLENSKLGLDYLPIVWNVLLDSFTNSQIQNGIGDQEDLLITAPRFEDENQSFDYYVSAEGIQTEKRQVYPEHSFQYRVKATGQSSENPIEPESFKFTVEAGEDIEVYADISVYGEYEDTTIPALTANVADYTTVSAGDLKPNNYVVNNVVIKNGNDPYIDNAQYIEILANLNSGADRLTDTKLGSVTVYYTDTLAASKKIIFTSTANARQDAGGNRIVDFFDDTWEDVSPILKVRSDSNDQVNVQVDSTLGQMKLIQGEYLDRYNNEGSWDNVELYNARISNKGTLTIDM